MGLFENDRIIVGIVSVTKFSASVGTLNNHEPTPSASVGNPNHQEPAPQSMSRRYEVMFGPSITLKVMSGDTFNVKVDSWYKTNGTSPGSAVNPLSDIVSAMINGVSGSAILNTHGATETTLGDGGAFTDVSSFLSNQDGDLELKSGSSDFNSSIMITIDTKNVAELQKTDSILMIKFDCKTFELKYGKDSPAYIYMQPKESFSGIIPTILLFLKKGKDTFLILITTKNENDILPDDILFSLISF